MKCGVARAWAIIPLTIAACTFASPCFAQVAPPGPEVRSGYAGPNRALLGTGIVTFGVAYVPAVVVAGESSQSVDHHLYVPVVGPWLDLANRPGCGPGSIACDTETTNKVLLATDGIFQGLGVISVVAAFLSPEHERAVVETGSTDKPTLHVSPAQIGAGGYGLRAFGQF
jgi:hypothetical protein